MANILQTTFFDHFAAGEYGQAGGWDVGWRLLRQQLLYAGYFTASNVQRTRHGTLVPRSGLVDITPTGVPTGALTGLCWTDVPSKDLLFSVGATVYDCSSGGGGAATAYSGTFAITPTVPVAFVLGAGGIVYASVFGDKTYTIDQNARTVKPLARITVADAVTTSGSAAFSSATMALTSFDVGTVISTPNFPAGTTIVSQTGTAGVASVNATASGTAQTLSVDVSPGGRCLAIYGAKLMVGNVSGKPNRVWFSGNDSNPPATEGDFTRWDPLNYVDIGDSWDVNALLAQRTSLMIAKQKSWYLMTGTPGVNDVVRPLNQNGPWVEAPQMAAMAGDNTVWFVDFNRDTPQAFNGSIFAESENLSFNGGTFAFTALPPTFSVCRAWRLHDIFYAAVTTPGGPMKAAIRQDGAWTFHTFNPAGGFQGAWVVGGDGHHGLAGLLMSSGGAGGVAAKFYAWSTNLDRPPISGHANESLGDASSMALAPTVTLPEYYVRGGEELQVRSVLVDFVRWNDGYGPNNHFDCQVQALDTYGDSALPGPVGNVLTQTFDAPASGAGGTGAQMPGRAVLNFNGELGNGWQVSFANVVGVEIKKVEVHFHTSTARGL